LTRFLQVYAQVAAIRDYQNDIGICGYEIGGFCFMNGNELNEYARICLTLMNTSKGFVDKISCEEFDMT